MEPSEDGAKECRWPPEARKDNKIVFPLTSPEGTALLANISHCIFSVFSAHIYLCPKDTDFRLIKASSTLSQITGRLTSHGLLISI